MRIQRIGFMAFACLLALAVVLSGCTKDEKTPKELLEASFLNSTDIKTYDFEGSFKLGELQLPASASDAAGELPVGDIASMLKGVNLSWTGVYSGEAKRTELTLVIGIGGDFAFNLTVPIISTPEKVWIKIPELPLPIFPEGTAGKFAEIDLKKLAETSGQSMPAIDPGQAQNLLNDVVQIVLKHVDAETYLTSVEPAELGAPEELKVKHAMQLQIGKEQLEPLVNALINNIIPETIDLLSANESYRSMFGVKPEELAEAKAKLESAKQQDVPEALAELKQNLKAFDFKSAYGVNGDNYPAYNRTSVALEWVQEGESAKAAFDVVNQLSNINGDAVFKYGELKPEEIIPMEQLQELFGGMLGEMAP